jgi:hypothetical protein
LISYVTVIAVPEGRVDGVVSGVVVDAAVVSEALAVVLELELLLLPQAAAMRPRPTARAASLLLLLVLT